MTQRYLTNAMIAQEALMLLENNLVMGNLVHRGYEDEFTGKENGYSRGDTISIRKPARYTYRSGAAMSTQDANEGKTSIVIDQQGGVDIGGWTSKDRTLNITQFKERFLNSAMLTIAQNVDATIANLGKKVWNWVGTPGTTLTTYAGFAKAGQRLDEMAVPTDNRNAVLCPADQWGLIPTIAASYNTGINNTALQKAKLPLLGGIDSYMSQNTPILSTGTRDNTTPLVKGASQATTWDLAKDSGEQTIDTDGWDNSCTLEAGMVFTIGTLGGVGVYAVNPVSKVALPYLQQFVVKSAVTAHASGGTTTLTVSPPMITSGAFQTVSAGPADDATITVLGAASTNFNNNLVFHKNAFALCMVPMVKPEGAVDVQSFTSKSGFSVRMIPVYTGSSDVSAMRLDVLFGVKDVFPDLATRLSGT